MQNMSRDSHELGEQVDSYVRQRGLSAAEAAVLRQKLAALLDWVKLFRRAAATARRHDATHPNRRRAADEVVRVTRNHVRTFGALTLRIGPGDAFSDEGLALPHVLDSDLEGYTFFALFRDGIIGFSIKPGFEPAEVEALLEVVAANGRREGDDAVTWLWAGRHRHLRLEVEPSLSPRVAATLRARNPDDLATGAYMSAFLAATPELRAPRVVAIGREYAANLTGYGVDPETVERLLTTGAPATQFPPPSQHIADNYARVFSDARDRGGRHALIASRAPGAAR